MITKGIVIALMVLPITVMMYSLKRYRFTRDRWALPVAALCLLALFVLELFVIRLLFSLIFILMLVMLWCGAQIKKNRVPWALRVTYLCGITVLILVIGEVGIQLSEVRERKAQRQRLAAGRDLQKNNWTRIGEDIGSRFTGKKALLVTFRQVEGTPSPVVEALKNGIGNRLDLEGPVFAEQDIPAYRVVEFDEVLKGREDVELVICLVSMFGNYEDIRLLRRNRLKRPKFILKGKATDLKQLLEREWIAGVIANIPEVRDGDHPPKRALRFVDRQLFEELKNTNPALFEDGK